LEKLIATSSPELEMETKCDRDEECHVWILINLETLFIMEETRMNLKLKSLVTAVAMTVAGMAQAASINTDNWSTGGANLSTGTGAGDLLFAIYDPGRAQSLVLNLNLTADTFRNSNSSLINTFSVTDSLLQSFIAGSSNQSLMQWNLGAISNSGLGPNAGILTTNGNAGATINPATQGPVDGNALEIGMDHITAWAQANNGLFTVSNPNSAISAASDVTGYLANGLWGSNFGNAFSFNNDVAGFGSNQLISFIALGATDVSDLGGTPVSNTFSNGAWHVNAATGTVSYVGTVSAVPVPAAVWLFGSGLLGLVGIGRRRKQI
jgi:hypothetical protein